MARRKNKTRDNRQKDTIKVLVEVRPVKKKPIRVAVKAYPVDMKPIVIKVKTTESKKGLPM